MERGLCFNDKDDSAVAQDGDYVYKAQWDGDPGVHVLQARNATQQEGGGHAAAVFQGPQWHCVWREGESWLCLINREESPQLGHRLAPDSLPLN